VAIAHTGVSALEEVRIFRPDAVLLDLGLPGMSGYEVARRIKAAQGDDQPMLLAVSGYRGEDLERRLEEAGFDEWIGKPFDLARLEEILARLNA
jgi:CheY-like chemotaxis protein